MDAITISRQLMNWTVLNSGHQERRAYIGLSGIGGCERAIYDQYRFGSRMSVNEQLRTRISYELEAAVIERLRGMRLYEAREEIVLFGGLVQGHTDGRIGEAVLEIKTLPMAAAFPKDDRLPRKHYQQVQAYMHFLKRTEAIMIYLERQNGDLRVYRIRYNERAGQEIQAKVTKLVEAVRSYTRPACTCGNCPKDEGVAGLEWLEPAQQDDHI